MSLVTSAAPVNYNDNNTYNQNREITKKNQTYKNKEIKKIKKEMIENSYLDSDDESKLGNFHPVQTNVNTEDQYNNSVKYRPNPKDDTPVNKETFSKLESTYANDYYKQYSSNQGGFPSSYQNNYQIPCPSVNYNTELLKKLDNILHLLEEQQEEKTNLITEELILYVFLGIFVIYVLDSFVRVGKYVR